MPVKKNRPSHEADLKELVAPIVAELNADVETGRSDAPLILEEYQSFSNRFAVRVVWDKWESVPPAERVPVILEAYRRSRRAEEARDITIVRGLTRQEGLIEEAVKRLMPLDSTRGSAYVSGHG